MTLWLYCKDKIFDYCCQTVQPDEIVEKRVQKNCFCKKKRVWIWRRWHPQTWFFSKNKLIFLALKMRSCLPGWVRIAISDMKWQSIQIKSDKSARWNSKHNLSKIYMSLLHLFIEYILFCWSVSGVAAVLYDKSGQDFSIKKSRFGSENQEVRIICENLSPFIKKRMLGHVKV